MIKLRPRYMYKATCKECFQHKSNCGGNNVCIPIKRNLRSYNGIRLTADGFDCALPVTIDSHSKCSYACIYCFSPNISGHREGEDLDTGQTSLNSIESLFSGNDKSMENFYTALKFKNRANGYPCPVQLGGLTDPLDNIERNQGWFFEFVRLAQKYKQPVRISTKGNLFLEQEYLDVVAKTPELFWVNFSIISPDDKLMKLIDVGAPPPSERIQCMKNLTEIKVKTGLRFRPIIPGISDATPDYPRAYSDLINLAADAGARNISYEVAFLPLLDPKAKPKWDAVEKITGIPYWEIYRKFGKKLPCNRASYIWTEQIMFAIHKAAKKREMFIGVSDPLWKQLNDGGCCCGIPPTDPVFGNWQRESATNQLVEARDTGKLLCPQDVIPKWALITKADQMYRPAIGPSGATFRQYFMWGDKMQEQWNDLTCERGPLQYFQGALRPVERKENGDMVFKYVGLERRNPKETPYWNIKED